MTTERTSRWGVGIAVLYIGFVLFILACVGFASLQDFDLVEHDYYAQGLAYETRLEKMRLAQQLPLWPSATYHSEDSTIEVLFPGFAEPQRLRGTVTLYRAASASHDREVAIAADTAGTMKVHTAMLPPGVWKVKIDWQFDTLFYYTELELVIE